MGEILEGMTSCGNRIDPEGRRGLAGTRRGGALNRELFILVLAPVMVKQALLVMANWVFTLDQFGFSEWSSRSPGYFFRFCFGIESTRAALPASWRWFLLSVLDVDRFHVSSQYTCVMLYQLSGIFMHIIICDVLTYRKKSARQCFSFLFYHHEIETHMCGLYCWR